MGCFITLNDLRGLGQTPAPAATPTTTPVTTPAPAPVVVTPAPAPVVVAPAPAPAPVVVAPTPAPVPVNSGELVRVALDAVMGAVGAADRRELYTVERIFAIRDEAMRRGVPPAEAAPLVRQEVWRRLAAVDPNPGGDLNELAMRLGGSGVPQTVVYQPAPQIIYQQAPPAPPIAPPGQARRLGRRREDEENAEPRSRRRDMTPIVLAACVGVLGTIVILNMAKD